MRRLFRLWQTGGSDFRKLMQLLRSPSRPSWLVAATVLLGIFAFDPFNFAIPFIGVIDDFVLLPLLLRWLVRAASADDGAAMGTVSKSGTSLRR